MGKRQFRELDGFIKNLKQDYSDAIVYLFGSRARGDELKDSDYDIFIISDKFKNQKFVKRLEKIQEYWTLPQLLESLCYTKEEFQEKMKQINIVSHGMKDAIKLTS
ncbi:MAG: nucleotidyltransferase domain-containing protein [Candidatus Micrarchaeia archaeon]